MGRPLKVILIHLLDSISGRSQDVRSGRPRDGQIGSLGDVLGKFLGPVFAGWNCLQAFAL